MFDSLMQRLYATAFLAVTVLGVISAATDHWAAFAVFAIAEGILGIGALVYMVWSD